MNKKIIYIITVFFILTGIRLPESFAQTQRPPGFASAVIFYSPECPHCHQVIEDILIPLKFQFPESLQIFGIDSTSTAGSLVFQNYIETFNISSYRQGVPALIVGNTVLVGEEIEHQAVPVIEDALSSGGAALPDIPGLLPDASASGSQVDLKPIESVRDEFLRTPPAAPQTQAEDLETADKILGLTVLLILIISLFFFFLRVSKFGINSIPKGGNPRIPFYLFLLVIAGLAISLYLSYVEIKQVDALCGPIGECNRVQESSFSRIFGFPVAGLGAVHYFIFFVLLWLYRKGAGGFVRILLLGLLFLALTAVMYSIFLTSLEIWVIHAVCAWCLGSAFISAAILMVLSKKFIFLHKSAAIPSLEEPE